jgi:hypothetical protein
MSIAPHPFPGKSYPMTVITPVRPRWRWLQRLVASVFKRLSLDVVHQLAFIHFARWITIRHDALPRLTAAQPAERLSDDLYLFTTNFNGPWDQYIDAFGRIEGVRGGLDWLWWTSRGFPGAWPMRPFKRYIRYFQYPIDLYYNAYPGASVRDIAAAIALDSRLTSFLAETAQPLPDAEFRRRYASFLDEVAPYLGAIGGDPHAIPSRHSNRPLGLQT